MELRRLRSFAAVAEERHFGRAAARLQVTRSALSAQVQGVEREVGGPVFARTSRRVELTCAGELLLVEARRTLALADRALSVARQSVSGEVGAVRTGFLGVALLEDVLTADLRSFHRSHPRHGRPGPAPSFQDAPVERHAARPRTRHRRVGGGDRPGGP
ncbi:LysR family transcriptional regulator [Streptomyces cinereospinus]|uniref:LysR family transcriptional regulator n=1 Tax=Streptomyces cinereospinus TaxID=285561 RepID=A0ABV5N7Z6_9ACTN